MKVKALIPTGLGFNCEYESAKAFELAGATSHIVDIRDIINGKISIFDYHILMLIGGFSYGDDLGSGKAIANLLRFKNINGSRFIDLIKRFVLVEKKIVFGVCNGFQVLVKLGILPGFDKNYEEQNCTITQNDSAEFEDRWINLGFNDNSRCIATKGLKEMYLPVRHGEGKIIADQDILDKLEKNNHIIAKYIDPASKDSTKKYPLNPNGSINSIAGICDETGRIFGMMPHPEAFLLFHNHPHWTRLKREYNDSGIEIPKHGEGLKIFENIVNYCKENLVLKNTIENKKAIKLGENMKEAFTYKDAGVDIHAADDNQKIIKNLIKTTYSQNVIPDTKGLGSMYQIPVGYKNPILISGTDSVGTKLKVAFEMNKHDTIGIDVVALCVNDIIRRGAKPLFFLDFIGIGKLQQNIVNEIIKGLITGCKQADCSLIGGETAQLPETYPGTEYELVGFSTGIIEKYKMITGDKIESGNVIIGLASSGIHSNGYTLARKLILDEYKIDDILYDNVTAGHALLEPSRIYVRPVLEILKDHHEKITGLCNITGSAFNKLTKLNENVGFSIKKLLPIPKIFEVLQKLGNLPDEEMFSTYNMGMGFAIIAKSAEFTHDFEQKYGYKAEVIGVVDDSKKVTIKEKGVIL